MGSIRRQSLALMAAVLMAAGCASAPETPQPVVSVPPSRSPMAGHYYATPPAAEGSLWSETGSELLFVDRRARRPGDTVIIDIVENASSKADANTETKGESALELDIEGMTGQNNINANLSPNMLWKSGFKNEFTGEATSDRAGQISASIGARVTEILPNGNLVVFGKRETRINNENQFITVSGIVRQDDVGADNHIKSVYLADARIEYYGEGVLADKQRPGWGSRLITWVWPF